MLGKGEIAQQVAQRTGMPKAQAARAVDAVLECVQAAVSKGEPVRLSGFGSFKVTETKARQGRNPRTGQPIQIAAGKRVSFSPGSKLVESVRGGGRGAAGGGRAGGGRAGGGGGGGRAGGGGRR
jgi:DNA-binding protein HU-beta